MDTTPTQEATGGADHSAENDAGHTPEPGDVHEDQCQARHPDFPASRCRLKHGHRAKFHHSLLRVWPRVTPPGGDHA